MTQTTEPPETVNISINTLDILPQMNMSKNTLRISTSMITSKTIYSMADATAADASVDVSEQLHCFFFAWGFPSSLRPGSWFPPGADG